MKDQRYFAIKSLIEAKRIKGLQEIFKIIPLSVVQQDMKANYSTFRKRVYSSDTLTVKDFRLMADLFEVDPAELMHLALADIKTYAAKPSTTKRTKG